MAVRNGGPLCAESQQRQRPHRHRSAGALDAVKKGKHLGGRRQQGQQQGGEEEAGGEEDAAAVEAMRLEKLAAWRAMMQSGEVGVQRDAVTLTWSRLSIPLFRQIRISAMDLLHMPRAGVWAEWLSPSLRSTPNLHPTPAALLYSSV